MAPCVMWASRMAWAILALTVFLIEAGGNSRELNVPPGCEEFASKPMHVHASHRDLEANFDKVKMCMHAMHLSFHETEAYLPVDVPELAECTGDSGDAASAPGQCLATPPPGHGKPFGEQGQRRVAIREIQGCISPERFLSEFVFKSRPVVFRGCGADAPYMSKWTDEYLHAHREGWTVDNWSFERYFKQYNRTDLPNEERQYRNLQVLPDELRADVPLPQMVWCGGLYQTYENLVMWLSKGGKFSKLHNDFGDFLLHQVDGQKHFLMVDPTQAHLLYYDFPRALHLVGTSGFDPQNVDMRKYPLARNVTIYESTISPGDIMYIPARWFHLVTSLPRDAPKFGGPRNLAFTFQATIAEVKSAHLSSGTMARDVLKLRHGLAGRSNDVKRCLNADSESFESADNNWRKLTLNDVAVGSLDEHLVSDAVAVTGSNVYEGLKAAVERLGSVDVGPHILQTAIDGSKIEAVIFSHTRAADEPDGIYNATREGGVVLDLVNMRGVLKGPGENVWESDSRDENGDPLYYDPDVTIEIVFSSLEHIESMFNARFRGRATQNNCDEPWMRPSAMFCPLDNSGVQYAPRGVDPSELNLDYEHHRKANHDIKAIAETCNNVIRQLQVTLRVGMTTTSSGT